MKELKLTIKTLEQGVKYVKVNNKDTRTTPTIETLEKGVKYVKVNNKDTRTTVVSLLLTLNIFHTFF